MGFHLIIMGRFELHVIVSELLILTICRYVVQVVLRYESNRVVFVSVW
jgi:hypothetical protein